jgi:hypothetical protein
MRQHRPLLENESCGITSSNQAEKIRVNIAVLITLLGQALNNKEKEHNFGSRFNVLISSISFN